LVYFMDMRAKLEMETKKTEIQPIGKLIDTSMLKRYHRLEVLERIASTANGQQDLDTILNIALDNVLEVVNCTIGGILLIDRDSGKLYFRAHRGMPAQNIGEIRIPLGQGIAGRVAQTGSPVLTENISRDPCVFQMESGSAEHLRAFVSVPLKRRDEIVGVMVVADRQAGKFGADDLSLLISIGDYLATAVVRSTVEIKIAKGMARYQALLSYALGAQEDERKRVARELHDETSQALTSLTFRLQAAIQMAETKGFGDDKFKESLRKAHSYAVQTGNEIVKLMMDLRPTLLDDLGMPAAIQRYAKDTLEARGINVSMEFVGGEHRLPTEVEVACFRVAQGLISNILRHAEAENVFIKVEYEASKAVLYIEDDGIGFDINKIKEIEPNGRGAGLFTMRERLRLVGGTGVIESRLGQGTRITVTVPIIRELKDLADEQNNSDDSR